MVIGLLLGFLAAVALEGARPAPAAIQTDANTHLTAETQDIDELGPAQPGPA